MTRYVDEVTARAYSVPTDAPEADGTFAWSSTTMVLVQVRSGDTVGTGWTYGPAAICDLVAEKLREVVVGRDVMAVPGTWEAMLRATRNATRQGLVDYGVSAVDVALWDLKARVLDLGLVDLFGAAQEAVAVYGSGGFTTYDDDRTVEQLTGWVHEQKIPRAKIKIGESWGSDLERDMHRIRLARRTIGDDAELFVDANGAYTAKQAIRLMRDVADADVHWFEEPVSSDHLDQLAHVRARVDADVTAGEYGTDEFYFEHMCAAGAVDCLQIDATRAGGYTAWFRCAAVAKAHGLEVSAHCAPHLHAPVAAATPHHRHMEWFHDHVRIESTFFPDAAAPDQGLVRPNGRGPGHGLTLDEDAAAPYLTHSA